MLNLTHVRSFLAVLDTHGVRSAAKALELSPSTIVEHISQLEAHLAAPLLERKNKSVKPSKYGMRFLPYARALIATAARARELVSEPCLRVAAASNIGVYLLQPSIVAFRRQMGIEVEMWIAPNRQVAERLERGEADIAAMVAGLIAVHGPDVGFPDVLAYLTRTCDRQQNHGARRCKAIHQREMLSSSPTLKRRIYFEAQKS